MSTYMLRQVSTVYSNLSAVKLDSIKSLTDEIRYKIWPLVAMTREYAERRNDPNHIASNPNELYEAMVIAMGMNISQNVVEPIPDERIAPFDPKFR